MGMLPMAICIAILAMLWTFVSPTVGVLTWPAFIGWAIYFVAGGELSAFGRGGIPLILGVLLAWLAVQFVAFNGGVGLPIAVGTIAFIMVMMANMSYFSLIPAQFIGAAIFFGTGADLVATLLSTAIGFALGYVSKAIFRFAPLRRSSQ